LKSVIIFLDCSVFSLQKVDKTPLSGVVGSETENKGVIPIQNRKRDIQIIVRVTEQERQLIEEKMKQIPTINLSAFARKMLIDGYIIQLDIAEVKTHSALLQKIGGNLNQIAKRTNKTGHIYADEMNEVKRLMGEVWKSERRLLLFFKGLAK